MNSIMGDHCHIVAENQRKQYEVKQNLIRANSVKRAACIIKRGRYYDGILSTVATSLVSPIPRTTPLNPSSKLSCPYLLTPLRMPSSIWRGIFSYFLDLKKQTVAVDITRMWGKDVIKEGAIVIIQLRGGPRMGQGWWYIVFFCLLSMFMRQVYPTNLLHKLLPLHLGGNHDHWVRGETNSAITL